MSDALARLVVIAIFANTGLTLLAVGLIVWMIRRNKPAR